MNNLDLTPRYAPDRVMMSQGRHFAEVPVMRYIVHPAGQHPPKCPIIPTMPALELVTAYGSRWYGVESGYINSELRMVITGTNPRDEVRMKWAQVPANRI